MSVSIFVCDLGRDKLKCDSCSGVATGTCAFELRGRLAGKTCGRRICTKCGGALKMCPPHQRVSALAEKK
jgi:hypothetical protein